MKNSQKWILLFSVFLIVGCNGSKTIWIKGRIVTYPQKSDFGIYSTTIEYKTVQQDEVVEKKRRFYTLRPFRRFFIGIKAQDFLHVERISFWAAYPAIIDVKLEGENFKRKIINVGDIYDYRPPIVDIPEDYNGIFSDFNFVIRSDIPDVDYFDVYVSILKYDNEKQAWKKIPFIDIEGLKNTEVSFDNFLDLAQESATFGMNDAKVTIHDELRPGMFMIKGDVFMIGGDVIRIIDEEATIISRFYVEFFDILKIE